MQGDAKKYMQRVSTRLSLIEVHIVYMIEREKELNNRIAELEKSREPEMPRGMVRDASPEELAEGERARLDGPASVDLGGILRDAGGDIPGLPSEQEDLEVTP